MRTDKRAWNCFDVVCEKYRAGFNGGEECLFHEDIYTQDVEREKILNES